MGASGTHVSPIPYPYLTKPEFVGTDPDLPSTRYCIKANKKTGADTHHTPTGHCHGSKDAVIGQIRRSARRGCTTQVSSLIDHRTEAIRCPEPKRKREKHTCPLGAATPSNSDATYDAVRPRYFYDGRVIHHRTVGEIEICVGKMHVAGDLRLRLLVGASARDV